VAYGTAQRESAIEIPVDGVLLEGDLTEPPDARGLVVFAHGSGSGRFSPRNRAVAEMLVEAGLATLLMDLLTAAEEAVDLRTGRLRFDIPLLGRRVIAAVDWLADDETTKELAVGCGGRPDLAGDALRRVTAPTLLIVGGNDPEVLRLNRQALSALPGKARLEVVPGATHLFEEPGALARVAALARDWFVRHLVGR
jgi:pimeloyl-ACP methyl ester carboxylesterase